MPCCTIVYVVKKFLNFFENLKLLKKPQATFKSQNSIIYNIYIIAKQLTLSQYSYKKVLSTTEACYFSRERQEKDKLTSIIFLTLIFSIRVDGVWSTNPDTGPPIALDVVSLLSA